MDLWERANLLLDHDPAEGTTVPGGGTIEIAGAYMTECFGRGTDKISPM